MRSASADYLEAAKIEDLAASLRSDGYRVEQDATVRNQVFDLLAERDGKRLVFEVKARSRLKESIDEVARLRAAALEAGVAEFRLVVVNPPHAVEATIEGLQTELLRFLVENAPPSALDRVASDTFVENVVDIEIQSIDVRRTGIRVRGRADVEVAFAYSESPAIDSQLVGDTFPFTFDIDLGRELKIEQFHAFNVEIGDFYRSGNGGHQASARNAS